MYKTRQSMDIFIILRIPGSSLHIVRINPGKNCALVFLIANHQQFCYIFSTNFFHPPTKVKWSAPKISKTAKFVGEML